MSSSRALLAALSLLLSLRPAAAAGESAAPEEHASDGAAEAFRKGGYGVRGLRRWRPEPVPLSADDARDPIIEKAMRESPALPALRPGYRGPQQAMKAARYIRKTVPTFINFRATIPRATWRSTPAHEWRVRPRRECLADLRRQGVHVKVWRPEDEDDVTASADDVEAMARVPAPVWVRSPIGGVLFRSGLGRNVLLSCEMASRLPVIAKIVAREGVDQVVITSAWRRRPRTSFHTMGLGIDIMRFHLVEPQPGPGGPPGEWLDVFSDFYATPHQDTCDPSLLAEGSPLRGNERGRRLLRIACALYRSGVFSSVLTPNYNPGHRDHFHLDIRPDDPRLFLR